MEDLLKKYEDARKALGEYFDAPIYHNLITNFQDQWTDYGVQHDSVAWEYQEDESSEWDDGEFMYSFEVQGVSRWQSKDGKYTLFIGRDCCGNTDCYIFLNELKMEGV
jgi:hypothetical protein